MANEITNRHTHDDGWLHRGWDFHKDRSVESAASKLAADASDGVTPEEILEFVRAALDEGQMTEREARQLSAGLRQHYGQMSPEARTLAENLDRKLQGLVGGLHDAGDGQFRTPEDTVVLEGDRLDAFLGDVNAQPLDLTPGQSAQEFLNEHTHDAGFLRSDFKYYTDATLDLAAQKLEAAGRDDIDAHELFEFVKAAGDFNQISFREARQLIGALNRLFPQMSPEAREIAGKLREALYEAYPPSGPGRNGILRGDRDILDLQDHEKFRNGIDSSNLGGEKLNALMAQLNNIANPLQKMGSLLDPRAFAAELIKGNDRAQPAKAIKLDNVQMIGSYLRG